jgi:hypothetical protein
LSSILLWARRKFCHDFSSFQGETEKTAPPFHIFSFITDRAPFRGFGPFPSGAKRPRFRARLRPLRGTVFTVILCFFIVLGLFLFFILFYHSRVYSWMAAPLLRSSLSFYSVPILPCPPTPCYAVPSELVLCRFFMPFRWRTLEIPFSICHRVSILFHLPFLCRFFVKSPPSSPLGGGGLTTIVRPTVARRCTLDRHQRHLQAGFGKTLAHGRTSSFTDHGKRGSTSSSSAYSTMRWRDPCRTHHHLLSST